MITFSLKKQIYLSLLLLGIFTANTSCMSLGRLTNHISELGSTTKTALIFSLLPTVNSQTILDCFDLCVQPEYIHNFMECLDACKKNITTPATPHHDNYYYYEPLVIVSTVTVGTFTAFALSACYCYHKKNVCKNSVEDEENSL